jgi:hypothetical protein
MPFRRQESDEIGYFDGRLPFFATSAGDLSNVGDPRPIRLQRGTQLLADQDHPVLDAPTMPIKRLGLLKLSLRISKRGCQIALECGLIAFDDKERRGVL